MYHTILFDAYNMFTPRLSVVVEGADRTKGIPHHQHHTLHFIYLTRLKEIDTDEGRVVILDHQGVVSLALSQQPCLNQ